MSKLKNNSGITLVALISDGEYQTSNEWRDNRQK